jgi:hypothetical protein
LTTFQTDLQVTFSREGAAEEVYVCADGDHALKSALRILAGQDALRVGDKITVEKHKRPGLIERGLA